jgi:RsiW-degrading membrane proteinase PrsW (M82 family)
MNRKYISAGIMALIGIALAATSIVLPYSVGFGGLVLASAAVPSAVLLVVVGRLDRKVPVAALIAGGTLAVAMSLIGYALLGGVVYFFVGGFGEWLVGNGDGVLDTDLMETLRDPWMIIFAIEVIVLAPLVEEFSKAISARLSKPFDRKSALLAGVAAGVGFAVIENIAYATGGFFVEGGWETVVLLRMLGSAVHPVAAGLVSLGWWEFRTQPDRATPLESVLVTIAYAGALGVIIAAAGWQALGRVANGDLPVATADPGDARTMSAWVVIASTVLVPAIAVVFALNSGFS